MQRMYLDLSGPNYEIWARAVNAIQSVTPAEEIEEFKAVVLEDGSLVMTLTPRKETP